MSTLCRLAGRQLCSKSSNYEKNLLLFIRPVTIKASQYKPKPEENFEISNIRLGRPLSPHLLIYSPQITSMLSITHRMTGMAMSGYVTMLGLGAFLPGDYTTFITGLHLGAGCLFMAKATLAWPFAYHFVNGIRHLSWDMGKFLTIKEVYSTGYVMLAISSVLAVALASM